MHFAQRNRNGFALSLQIAQLEHRQFCQGFGRIRVRALRIDGSKAVLHEVSVSGTAAFGNLKLAPGWWPGARRLALGRGGEGPERDDLLGLGERPGGSVPSRSRQDLP